MAGFSRSELANVHKTRRGRQVEGLKRGSNYRDEIVGGKNKNYYYVWGNLIATLTHRGTLTIYDGGWRTKLTKDRLNGLLWGTGWGITQRDYSWYLQSNGTKKHFRNGTKITSSGGIS